MIAVEKLTRRFGDIVAVDDIAFEIREGEIAGFLGPNGAGKTTTLRMLVGYLQPTQGFVNIGGRDINVHSLEIARIIGYLPENNPLYDELTVYDYLKFIAEIRRMKQEEFDLRLRFVIEKCGLREVIGQQIATLSKGYRQRTGLAQAILHDPQVLILDEPTSGLDPNQILEIRELIKDLGREKTVLLSSHIMQEVQAVCDRIIIINKGKIIADEQKDNLSRYITEHTQLTVELDAETPDFEPWLQQHPEVQLMEAVSKDSHWELIFSFPAGMDVQRELSQYISANGWLIISMYRQQHTLEQIFHILTTSVQAESPFVTEEAEPEAEPETEAAEKEDESNA